MVLQSLIIVFISLISFILGRYYQMRIMKIKSEKIIKEHISSLDRLIEKIHRQQRKTITGDYNVKVVEDALKNAIEEERYEDASELRDILKEIKNKDNPNQEA